MGEVHVGAGGETGAPGANAITVLVVVVVGPVGPEGGLLHQGEGGGHAGALLGGADGHVVGVAWHVEGNAAAGLKN